MKLNALFILPAFLVLASAWHSNLEEACALARVEHKHVLLNFSGSDWCGPCMRMRKEIFESRDFLQMADSELILVNADFPRMKKNQLAGDQQKLNNSMADRYNPEGKFPFTVLLDANGKLLQEWDGFPDNGAGMFIMQIRNGIYRSR